MDNCYWDIIFEQPSTLEIEKEHLNSLRQEELYFVAQKGSEFWGKIDLKISKFSSEKQAFLILNLANLMKGFVSYPKNPKYAIFKKQSLIEYHLKENLKMTKEIIKSVLGICESRQTLLSLETEDLENLGAIASWIK